MREILILSNKEDLAAQLRRDLERMGYDISTAPFDGTGEAIHRQKPALVLADLTLPGGIIDIWRQLQHDMADNRTDAIILISRDRIMEIELLAEMNDFVLWPYDVRELDMRIKLIMRQQREDTDVDDIIEIGNMVIDDARYEVTVDGEPVVLTLKEYELLRYLATRRGRVITREVLLDQVWGYNYYGGTRTVDVHIGRIRTKIETGDYSFIRTVRGVGYIFTDEYRPAGQDP
jgi:DNA-binding response OmpR family regulator